MHVEVILLSFGHQRKYRMINELGKKWVDSNQLRFRF
uniref:Uncharacterized protein n=1 Tax=Anguilla anguilla TaxID=7936 RepID=A0A0E9VJR3_ANGAN